jgi:hypothetical protein
MIDQNEINKTEWENLDNWSGPEWLSMYNSKMDTRTWVAKQFPALGWTIKPGNIAGVLRLFAYITGLSVLVSFLK